MTDLVGILASVLVLATFSMRTMLLLRLTAICSNVAFIWYGVSLDLVPIWTLHALLLPMNLWYCACWWRERQRGQSRMETA